jgi:large subunit ribosomal protein L7/L12
MTDEKTVELKGDAKTIAELLEKMTVLEVSELVKALEEKFGVSAAAPAMMMAPAAGGAAAEEVEEKSTFDVVLTEAGGSKIEVIKIVKTITGLGLKEAKDMVEATPANVKEGIGKAEAEDIKGQLEAVGAKVELK